MAEAGNVPQKIPVRRRSSLFQSDQGSISASPVPYKPSYEKQLKNEIESWNKLVRDKVHEINEFKKNNIELNVSLLSDEQRRYLSAGPTVDEVLKESNDFAQLLERYIQRKSFLARRYDAILKETRSQMDNVALDVVENELLSKPID
ncbi:AAEL003515-PB [Aedes aegypti]|uniref:AAEL003515-PA n=2 Tax=Aedes aegypti TaxID=7159 RepID=J9HFB5_AEDAE|nr:uncharacterized protein LOC5578357 [Aedes aegypti]EAT45182.1 AAEL003515-PA [Aedes aegypti]EJY57492.1 AAEL003515-PB [Aedes aegypti]